MRNILVTGAASLALGILPLSLGAQDVTAREGAIQHLRPYSANGINQFEAPKRDTVPFDGIKVKLGAAFTQQFQGLRHSNDADSVRTATLGNANRLMEIGSGFNNAVANLYIDAQLAKGVRVAMTSYLSSRHHNETWVKDGYLQIDDIPFELGPLNDLMRYLTIKAGHFEVNYGDLHFRRTDNGQAMHNPFVGNPILDAFTTEIGTEVYFQNGAGVLAMVGATAAESRGNVLRPNDKGPAFVGKLGIDRQLAPNVRARLTGSIYTVAKSPGVVLYAGDRAGSRYYMVLENSAATEAANFTSGLLNPNFRREITATMINPFVQVGPIEVFGAFEQAKGRGYQPAPNNLVPEVAERSASQALVDVIYRPTKAFYVGGRYNTATAQLAGFTDEVSIDRRALGLGWFITPNIGMKGEYVVQEYDDFPRRDVRSGGKFNGFVIEGVVAF